MALTLSSPVDRQLQLQNELEVARQECAQMRLARDAALEEANLRAQVIRVCACSAAGG